MDVYVSTLDIINNVPPEEIAALKFFWKMEGCHITDSKEDLAKLDVLGKLCNRHNNLFDRIRQIVQNGKEVTIEFPPNISNTSFDINGFSGSVVGRVPMRDIAWSSLIIDSGLQVAKAASKKNEEEGSDPSGVDAWREYQESRASRGGRDESSFRDWKSLK